MSESLKINPLKRPADAEISVPGSKSYTNRALVVSALAEGESLLTGALRSDDTERMSNCLNSLGFEVTNSVENVFTIRGAGGRIPAAEGTLFVGNSGTTARFITALVSVGSGSYLIDGVPRMRQRPIQDLLDGLDELGVESSAEMGNGCPPVRVLAKGIRGGTTHLPGNRSSQYLTAILLVSPYASKDVNILISGELVSKPYVDMTIEVMARFGIEVENQDYSRLVVKSGQRYQATEYPIEPDASNASYFFAAAALTGGRVKVMGIPPTSVQGDMGFVDILEKMGCMVTKSRDNVEVIGPARLRGIDIDMNDMPDVVQTVCALAPFADGPVNIRNIANLRIKETDRIAAMATELRKLGVEVHTKPDGMTIQPAKVLLPARLDTYEDHRMAMSLALIGLKASGIEIRDPSCVRKSFPTFFDLLGSLH
jgi:3-phosphoshikimate 1-carboxyvinyltransferase